MQLDYGQHYPYEILISENRNKRLSLKTGVCKITSMANNTLPEKLLNQFSEFTNSKDLDSLVKLYEPDACFTDKSGTNIIGREKIRERLKGFLDMNGKLGLKVRKIIPAGDIVLAYSNWTFVASGPDGSPINLSGKAIDVLRKQPDNTWRVLIDSPWGIET